MAEAQSPERWKHLGHLLESQRVRLDTRYANLTLFVTERGLDYRVAWDIENDRRHNYRRPTLTAIEIAYGLTPGSITEYLAGEIEHFDAPAGPYDDDPELAQLWRTTAGLPEDRRHATVDLARQMRARSRAQDEKATQRQRRA